MSDTDADTLLADSARDYLQRGYGAAVRAESLAHVQGCSARRWQEFADMGWLALPLAEADGGLGGSMHDICTLSEAMGQALVIEPFVACAVLGSGLLSLANDADVRAAWLPAMAEGRLRVAAAPLPSGVGADHHSIPSRARAAASGYTLQGQDSLVPGGHGAHAYLVLAMMDGGKETGLFLVAADAPGLRATPCTLLDGQHAVTLELGTAAGSLLFQGAPDVVRRRVEAVQARAAVAHCAETVGTMQRAFDITIDYLKTRKQFGRTIASNQVVQHRLVDLFVEITEARAVTYSAAAMMDQTAPPDLPTLRHQVAAARACVLQAAHLVWNESVQLHGAIGMTDEYIVGQYVKRLVVAGSLHGSLEGELETLAAGALDGAQAGHG